MACMIKLVGVVGVVGVEGVVGLVGLERNIAYTVFNYSL